MKYFFVTFLASSFLSLTYQSGLFIQSRKIYFGEKKMFYAKMKARWKKENVKYPLPHNWNGNNNMRRLNHWHFTNFILKTQWHSSSTYFFNRLLVNCFEWLFVMGRITVNFDLGFPSVRSGWHVSRRWRLHEKLFFYAERWRFHCVFGDDRFYEWDEAYVLL